MVEATAANRTPVIALANDFILPLDAATATFGMPPGTPSR